MTEPNKQPTPNPELSIDQVFAKMSGHHRSYIAGLVPYYRPEPSPENNLQMSGATLAVLNALLEYVEEAQGIEEEFFTMTVYRLESEYGLSRAQLDAALRLALEKCWIAHTEKRYCITGSGIDALRYIGARHLKEEVAEARKRIQDLDIG